MPPHLARTNPWRLSPRQIEALDSLIEHGMHKVAAHRLGLSIETFKDHCEKAKYKINAGTTLQCVVAYALWRTSVSNDAVA